MNIEGKENAFALVNAAGNATVDQSHHVVIYNYYQSEFKSVAVEVVELDDNLPCPYRGLSHFGPGDAEFFFGREVFVAELVEAVQNRAFVPVLGASGSGKSSVVFAGLVPQLQQLGRWQFTYFRPGTDPFHAVASALVPLYTPERNETEQLLQARDLAAALQGGRLPLGDVIARIQRNYPQQRVLLIADQFEELYTLCPEEATRRQFLDCLLASLTPAQAATLSPLVLVATMRADFLGSALSYRPLADVLQAGDVKLGAMNREELGHVIEQPAAKLGVSFEPGLAKRILDAVDKEPGNLPLLEFALTELWKQRQGKQLTHTAYDAIGEVQGALACYADEQYARLQPPDQAAVRRIFVQLVRPGEGTEDTRRLATKAELGEDRWALVKQLADTRLVVTSQDGGKQETVEVVHEALIRHWGELRGWIATDREFLTWQGRLRGAMQQWETTSRDEGALLRGAALAEAEERLQLRREDLGEVEQSFIQLSIKLRNQLKEAEIARQQREVRQSRRIAAGAIGAAIVTSTAGILALAQWNESQKRNVAQLIQLAKTNFLIGQELDGMVDALKAERLISNKFLLGRAALVAEVQGTLIWFTSEIHEYNKWRGTQANVTGIAFITENQESDRQKLVVAGENGVAQIWDLTGNQVDKISISQEEVKKTFLSPNGLRIAVFKSDGFLEMWDVISEKLIISINLQQEDILDISISPDNQNIATVDSNGETKIWNLARKTATLTLERQDNRYKVKFSSDGQSVAVGGDEIVELWDLKGYFITSINTQQKALKGIEFSHDGQKLVTFGAKDSAKLWDLKNKSSAAIDTKQGIEITANQGAIHSAKFNPIRQQLITAGEDGSIKLWDLSGNLVTILETYQGSVSSIAFSQDGKWLATGSSDGTSKIWYFGEPVTSIIAQQGAVNSTAFSPDSRELATAGSSGTMKLWDLTSAKSTIIVPTGHNQVDNVASSSRGYLATSGSDNGTVRLWNLLGESVETIPTQLKYVFSMAFSPDGLELAMSGETVKLWNSLNETIVNISTQQGEVLDLEFNSNGNQLATGGGDGSIKLWTSRGDLIWKKIKYKEAIFRLAFSPDGEQLATISNRANKSNQMESTLTIWDTQGNPIISVPTEQSLVWDIAFSRDGKYIASAGNNGVLKLWNTEGKLIANVSNQQGIIYGVTFSPDGKKMAFSQASGTISLLQTNNIDELEELVARSCDWLQDYFNNPLTELTKEDKNLCKFNHLATSKQ
ncbi:WD40 repeat domain-containing protein [Nodosilinea nodulosa]|uniref:WD40 repeat domain-containing protein n=1 Tax=Nodosilinea nodulosa TaxID=416001 RepID=UPI000475316A|nr:WD40 repeat domain-containing protein [Nodosilinea nodulosa]